MARLLEKYVRDEKVISLAEAVTQIKQAACNQFTNCTKGRAKAGNNADVVIFDASAVQDRACTGYQVPVSGSPVTGT